MTQVLFYFGRWWELWEEVACLGDYTWSLVPFSLSASPWRIHAVTYSYMMFYPNPWGLAAMGTLWNREPTWVSPCKVFSQIFDGQITPCLPVLMIPCPLHSIMVTKAFSIFKASGELDSVSQVLIFFCILMHFHREAIFKADRITFALLDT